MPKVSILLPSYNHAAYVEACVRSIQAQTMPYWELVAVDDGSRDDSVSILRGLAAEDPRISVHVNETNLGTYGTEQRALEMARAPLIAVMNSDDLWHPQKLEVQTEALERDESASFSYVLGAMVDDAGEMIDEDVHFDWPRDPRQDPLPWLLYENRILASGVLFRREGLRFETTCRYSGDWVALLEASRRGHARCAAEPMTFWRQHETNTYRRSVNQMREEIRVRRAIDAQAADWFLPRLDPHRVRRGLAMNLMNLVALYVYFGDMAQARRCGWRAVRLGADRKRALKRTLGTYLGRTSARNHLWDADSRAAADGREDELLALLGDIPPLTLG